MHGALLVLLLPTTWIVDSASGPGTNFTDLPPAIAAAQSGDTILVRAGSYSAFTVSGKALTIRGAGTVSTIINSATLGTVPAGQQLLMTGVSFLPSTGVALTIQGPGNVVLVSCSVKGGFGFNNGGNGLELGGACCTRLAADSKAALRQVCMPLGIATAVRAPGSRSRGCSARTHANSLVARLGPTRWALRLEAVA